jgi:hypothetical protein
MWLKLWLSANFVIDILPPLKEYYFTSSDFFIFIYILMVKYLNPTVYKFSLIFQLNLLFFKILPGRTLRPLVSPTGTTHPQTPWCATNLKNYNKIKVAHFRLVSIIKIFISSCESTRA